MKLYSLILFTIVLVTGPVWASDTADTDNASATPFSSRGDAEKGRKVFLRCQTCHDTTASRRIKPGPHLENLFGRQAGTLEGFARYSRAMREADFIWTEARLNEWLVNPRGFMPGNTMAFNGLRREQDRLDLIAYLRSLENGS